MINKYAFEFGCGDLYTHYFTFDCLKKKKLKYAITVMFVYLLIDFFHWLVFPVIRNECYRSHKIVGYWLLLSANIVSCFINSLLHENLILFAHQYVLLISFWCEVDCPTKTTCSLFIYGQPLITMIHIIWILFIFEFCVFCFFFLWFLVKFFYCCSSTVKRYTCC